VAVITAMAQLAMQVGASRVVVGRKIPHPCGDPNLPQQFDSEVRNEIVSCALGALEEKVESSTIFSPSHVM
jgi:glycine/betaine/sarcosine/D-proline reductase family selenoprotein B